MPALFFTNPPVPVIAPLSVMSFVATAVRVFAPRTMSEFTVSAFVFALRFRFPVSVIVAKEIVCALLVELFVMSPPSVMLSPTPLRGGGAEAVEPLDGGVDAAAGVRVEQRHGLGGGEQRRELFGEGLGGGGRAEQADRDVEQVRGKAAAQEAELADVEARPLIVRLTACSSACCF